MKALPPFGHGHHHRCGRHDPRGRVRLMERTACPRASGLNDEIAWLEHRQRDIEQELADVVERLRRLRGPADGPQTPA